MKSVASWAVGLGILTFASTEYLPHSIAYETPYSTPVVEKLTDGDPSVRSMAC